MTAMGLIAIENIKAGDKVISTDPETMETDEKTVLETYIREVKRLVRLTINGEEIITTFDHPFYVRGLGFVNACELWVGAQLIDVNETILTVENTRIELAKDSVRSIVLILKVSFGFGKIRKQITKQFLLIFCSGTISINSVLFPNFNCFTCCNVLCVVSAFVLAFLCAVFQIAACNNNLR